MSIYPVSGSRPGSGSAFVATDTVITRTVNVAGVGVVLTEGPPVLNTTVPTGFVVYTGKAPDVSLTTPVDRGLINFFGRSPALPPSAIAVGLGLVIFHGQAPSLPDVATAVGVGSVVFTGKAPVGIPNVATAVGKGSIVFTGKPPVVDPATAVPVGSVVFTGKVPVGMFDGATVLGTGQIIFTGKVPIAPAVISPGPGHIVFTGKALTISSVIPASPVGTITYTGFPPASYFSILVGSSSVVFTGTRPANVFEIPTLLGAGEIAITGHEPFPPTPPLGIDSGLITVTGRAFTATAHSPGLSDRVPATFKMARDPSEMRIPRPGTDWFFRHQR